MNTLLNIEGRGKQAALKKKSVAIGSRGRQSVNEQEVVEKQLLEWLEKLWENEKRVTRTMIFRKVLEINPKFKGGPKAKVFFCIHEELVLLWLCQPCISVSEKDCKCWLEVATKLEASAGLGLGVAPGLSAPNETCRWVN